ncbi:MAG: Tim44 domain-containing protein [Robiginitomaculum sp.]|nr:Tim44 domain-containing protein [Robiginitomaculum sp.]
MQEIILYAVLTVIVGAMLYTVLGKNVGHGPEKAINPKDILDKLDVEKKPEPQRQDFTGPAAQGLAQIAASDPGFSLPEFLDGAKGAYGMILEAFAEADKDTLASLLTDDVRDSYFNAIDELADKGLKQVTDLARLIDAKVVSAECVGKVGTIRVAYFAELATALTDKDDKVVEGDLDVLSQVREVWSYERDLKSKNPNWKLSGVEPHTSNNPDKDGPDHSPDTE